MNMRLKEIHIKNYRSLKDIHLDNLKKLNVLIGRNGSGKSHILEALELFFGDLDLMQQTNKNFEENLWYDRDNRNPISFKVQIELTDKQITSLFNDDFFKSIEISPKSKIKTKVLTIEREISSNQWNNKNIAFGDWSIVKDDQLITDNPQFGFSEESSIIDDALPLLKPTKENQNKDIKGKPIFIPSSISTAALKDLLTKINVLLNGKFRIIQTSRESSERSNSVVRSFIVDLDTRNYLINIGQNPAREDSQKWSSCKKMFKEYSSYTLEMRGGAIQAEIDDLYLPLNLLGSGDQAILILERLLSDKGLFYGIEEPETRLHADYQRKLFNRLKLKSVESQLFITTHSSIFIDKIDFDNSTIWLVKKDGKFTKIESILNENDGKIKNILTELGIKMSDVLFPEKILFVEGNTEKELIPLIAKEFKFDFVDNDVEIIAMRGKNTGKYHIEMWHHIGKNANLPMFYIFDNDGKKEIDECIEKGYLNDENHILLKEKDIEDYYPEDELKSAIKTINSQINLENIDLSKPRKERLSNLFKKHNIDHWKVDLGKNVITSINDKRKIKAIFAELKKGFDALS
jgi:putative ATP-dependent endonuclease of the OLD family